MLDRTGSGARWRSRRARAGAVVGLLLAASGGVLTWRAWHRPPGAGQTGASSAGAEVRVVSPPGSVAAPVPPAMVTAPPPSPAPLPLPATQERTSGADAVPATAGKASAAPLPRPPSRPRATRGGTRPTTPTTDGPRGTPIRPGTTSAAAAPETTPVTTAAPPPAHPDEKPAGASTPNATTAAAPSSAPEQRASLTLRASYGFCEPSLDAQAPSLRANYNDLSPGRHDIFCTLPQGGPKVHVTTYDLRPGARASLVIVPGPAGRPIIGRTE